MKENKILEEYIVIEKDGRYWGIIDDDRRYHSPIYGFSSRIDDALKCGAHCTKLTDIIRDADDLRKLNGARLIKITKRIVGDKNRILDKLKIIVDELL